MSRRRYWLALAVIAADQLTKVWARSLSAPLALLPGLFQARHTENTGIAFSLISGAPWLVTLLTAALILAALWLLRDRPIDRLGGTGAALALGGAVSNLIDRVWQGSVTDWIEPLFVRFAVFNLADALLVTGIALVALSLLLHPQAWDKASDPHTKEKPHG